VCARFNFKNSWFYDILQIQRIPGTTNFTIFGHLKQKIWIKLASRYVWFNLIMDSNWILKPWNIIALLDSIVHKLSNDIKFEIFGCRNQKIWFFKVWTEFRFKFLFQIEFDSGADTWLLLIARYRFSWIMD
jgi:hypothetical protein